MYHVTLHLIEEHVFIPKGIYPQGLLVFVLRQNLLFNQE